MDKFSLIELSVDIPIDFFRNIMPKLWVFFVGLFSGMDKPKSMQEYTQEASDELWSLESDRTFLWCIKNC